jgi:hypothetical protein
MEMKDCPDSSAPGGLTRNLYVLPIRKEAEYNYTYCLLLEPAEGMGGHCRHLGVYSIKPPEDWQLFEQAVDDFALCAKENGFCPDEEDEKTIPNNAYLAGS